jgi:hypothetical protein
MRFGFGFLYALIIAVIVIIARTLGINVSEGFYLAMIAIYVVGLIGWNFYRSNKNTKEEK